ncbi:MAG TPA: GNAT family N-acetyltransferase [Saprospiraceae bacterium]|nr:GNAT family N-acetyltransferase [Saprospiraceae bacterium]
MIIREIEYGTPDFDEALKLRTDVLRKPLNLMFKEEEIEEEYKEYHIGTFTNGSNLIAVLSLRPIDTKEIKMRQVAVSPNFQYIGIGKELVYFSEQFLIKKNFNRVSLHARDTAVPFYLKLNYLIKGDVFEEVGIPHVKMFKEF